MPVTAQPARRVVRLKPQEAQEKFLSTPADIAIGGGSAGGGKTWSLLFEPLRHHRTQGFTACIFRRTYPEITAPDGPWAESGKAYPLLGAKENQSRLEWRFPSGAIVKFSHLQHAKDVRKYLGAQICYLAFDQLETFCLTPDHEVLTDRGWVFIDDVGLDDLVLSREPDGSSCFREVAQVHQFRMDGDLVDVYQRSGLSFRATKNHRVLIRRQDSNGSLGYVRVDHLLDTVQVVPRVAPIAQGDWQSPMHLPMPKGRGVCAHRTNCAESIPINDYLELLGWYLAEGCSYQTKSGGGSCVIVCQMNRRNDLDDLFGRLPYVYRWNKRGGRCGTYTIYSRQLYEHFKPMGDVYSKHIPRWVFERCSPRQMGILFDAFSEGDGNINRKTGAVSIGLANKGLRDDLQELCCLMGRVSTAGEYQPKPTGIMRGTHCRLRQVYTLSVHEVGRKPETMVSPRNCRKERYKGPVYCLTVKSPRLPHFTNGGKQLGTVPGGNFLIRHRGRVSFTGNSEDQFFYMLSRNRSTCGVRPYVRATANPEPGWLADFLAWWIGPDGFPIKEREGKIRWMVRLSNVIHWADSWADLHERFPNKVLPEGVYDPPEGDERVPVKSVTFIPFGLDDNPILKRSDPGYRANLEALPHIQKMRLLKGNWLVSSAQGEWPASYFERVRVELVPVTHFLASVVACDPSKGRQDRFGDYCAYVWLRVDKTLTLWLDAWLGKWTSTELLEEGLAICRHVARLQGGSLPPIVFEINQFQELLAGDFNRLCLARGLFPQVYGIDNRTPKPVRIRRLGPFLAQGRLKVLSPSPGGDLLVQQLRDFGPADPTRHDDGPDAAEMAVRMAEFLLYGAGAVEGSVPQLLAGQPVNVHEYPVPPNYAGPLPPPPGMPPFNPSPGNGNGDSELSRQERMAQILGGSGLPLR